MSGTKAGGMKAAATNKARYGEGFYSTIGHIGGSNGTSGGFATDKKLARIVGAKGGRMSIKRRKDESDESYELRKQLRRTLVLARDRANN